MSKISRNVVFSELKNQRQEHLQGVGVGVGTISTGHLPLRAGIGGIFRKLIHTNSSKRQCLTGLEQTTVCVEQYALWSPLDVWEKLRRGVETIC